VNKKVYRIPLASFETIQSPEKTTVQCNDIVDGLLNYGFSAEDPPAMTMATFLTLLNVDCWEALAHRIIRQRIQSPLTAVLWKHGWLIASEELPKLQSTSNGPWIGYVDIELIRRPGDIEGQVYVSSAWREFTPAEKQTIRSGRTLAPTPDPLYGFYELYARKGQSTVFKFKLMLDTAGTRKKTGIVATSLTSKQLMDIIERLQNDYQTQFHRPPSYLPNFSVPENQSNRTYLASWVAYYLGMMDRWILPMAYKK
jgi:hypothetical protein